MHRTIQQQHLVHRPASLATVTPHSLIPGITTLKNKAKPAGLSPTPTPLTHPYTLRLSFPGAKPPPPAAAFAWPHKPTSWIPDPNAKYGHYRSSA